MRKTKFLALLMSVTMALSVIPVYAVEEADRMTVEQEVTLEKMGTGNTSDTDYKYAVSGGYIYFDESTGTITGVDESITSVNIPSTINGKAVTSIGTAAFLDCTITSVTMPSSVTTIESSAFANCGYLTSITIPSSVTSIGNMAFNGCRSLPSITIPSSVTSIGESGVFANCDSLISITVDANNPNYSSQDGILFNKDKTELVCYPVKNTDTSYTIPSTVTTIRNESFYGSLNLTSITIPNSVTTIESVAFYSCENLISILIPSSVTKIEGSAFVCCFSLTDVYYTGSQAQWSNISIDSYNDDLTNATIHYNYGMSDPTLVPLLEVGEFNVNYDRERMNENGYVVMFDSSVPLEIAIENTSDVPKQIISALIIVSRFFTEVYFIDETIQSGEEVVERITCQSHSVDLTNSEYYIVDFNSIDEMYDFRDGFCIKDDSVMTLNYFIPGGMDTLLK